MFPIVQKVECNKFQQVTNRIYATLHSVENKEILVFLLRNFSWTANVVKWSEFLATDSEVPGSIPDSTRFSEK
jgi:hypothetical protein